MSRIILVSSFVAILLAACGRDSSTTGQSVTRAPQLTVQLQPGFSYKWYADSACTTQDREICVTDADYKALCQSAVGSTVMASNTLVIYNTRASYLLKNGEVDSIDIIWRDGYKYGCRMMMQVSGLYQGSSARETLHGGISTFIFTQEGKVLAFHASEGLY